MAERFPDYDVLAKRGTPSWNGQTRQVVDERLMLAERADVLTEQQLLTLRHLVQRIAPQPENRPPANTVALVLRQIADRDGGGFRHYRLPPVDTAWRQGLDALDAEAKIRFGRAFAALDGASADALLAAVEQADTCAEQWRDLPPDLFWHWRLLPDIVSAHWSHPSLWSAMGFGGPAAPRGYVRLDANRRDPWEAREVDSADDD